MKSNKFNKDQIQKIALSVLGFIGLIYCYFSFFLGPLNKSRESAAAQIADVHAKTASSKTEMKKTANLEMQAKEATGRYEALKATTADGAPIAWFPPKMRTFFGEQGIDKVTARLEASGEFKQPELADWIKDSWAIELPQSEYGALGKAIAELENREPLLAIQRLVIHAVPEEPQYQQVSLSVQTALLKK
ncbi:MAG: hypothetical protein ABIR38_02040 [Chthoniobacterales bacterium]|nr:hypothetical protein [Verrucomicrobiota bacterium]